jgi:uncharacterized protein (DUF1778 family)
MLTTQKRETIVVYRTNTQTGVAVRTAPINLRALPAQRDLIDQAAAAQGKSRSDFMLEAACVRAEEVLLDQTFFVVDEQAFRAVQEMLDAPLAENLGLAKLLAVVPPWPTAKT